MQKGAEQLRGQSDEENTDFGERVFAKRIGRKIFPEAREIINAHREMGHTVGLVSSATQYQVLPVARELDFEHIRCTIMEVVDGVCTGRVDGDPCYGERKADAIEDIAEEESVDLAESYFYSDGSEDIPSFELVGNPCAVNPDDELTDAAKASGWPMLFFKERRASVGDMFRTGLFYSLSGPVTGLGAMAYALSGSLDESRNLTQGVWSELALQAVGIKLSITGEENLWKARPAVFVFNHQSGLDAIIMARLIQRDCFGIAKKELRSNPIFGGPAAELMGTVFVDRGNTQQAVEAMKPAVDRIHEGKSVIISPEGTRSVTNKLGPFKKGAFHLAMQAGVPMVPIVLKHPTDFMPKGAFFAKPGNIEVMVLDPIKTGRWSVKNINKHVADVRKLYLDALGQS
ncbi:MAG: HAD-IB family hydrolase [Pseudomonadota bacterium]